MRQTSRRVVSLLAIIAFPFLLLIFVWTQTSISAAESKNPAALQDQPYSVETVLVTGTLEYRFKYHTHHFMTLIDDEGTFNFRPHPGCDVNGWGTSWYAQPFLPGAKLKHTSIQSVTADSAGIHVFAVGKVSRGTSASYGDWGFTIDFEYAPAAKKIMATGEYTVTLAGPLSNATGDLNLYRIASNYLDDVPLLSGGIGDTGDMAAAAVMGDDFTFTWIPTEQPSHFPTDQSDSLSIDVLGQFNNVDTVEMGYERIAPAFKPGLKVVLISQQANAGMTFGAIYTLADSQKFWTDNVGITPLIPNTSAQTAFHFDVVFESSALEDCFYLPLALN